MVLVTGGSVACQLGQNRPVGPRYLEDALNRRFVPPKGADVIGDVPGNAVTPKPAAK